MHNYSAFLKWLESSHYSMKSNFYSFLFFWICNIWGWLYLFSVFKFLKQPICSVWPQSGWNYSTVAISNLRTISLVSLCKTTYVILALKCTIKLHASKLEGIVLLKWKIMSFNTMSLLAQFKKPEASPSRNQTWHLNITHIMERIMGFCNTQYLSTINETVSNMKKTRLNIV